MKIDLRNVKHARAFSEETECFQATVYIDGKNAGTVRNDGKGGSNYYEPYTLWETLNRHAKTLPPIDYDGHAIAQNADLLIGAALDRWDARRDYLARSRRRVVYLRDGKIYQSTALSPVGLAAALKSPTVLAKLNAEMILNLLPVDDAASIYFDHAR